jgi:alkylation response protein AidB-like acyl-CoA dehydrogenase
MDKWRATLNEKGWVTPAWPKQYGGGELDVVQQYVMNEIFAEERAPKSRVPDVGSTIMVHGSDAESRGVE